MKTDRKIRRVNLAALADNDRATEAAEVIRLRENLSFIVNSTIS
jgi:hypothetical protein